MVKYERELGLVGSKWRRELFKDLFSCHSAVGVGRLRFE